jgi:predicted TIM-barrel enzyme
MFGPNGPQARPGLNSKISACADLYIPATYLAYQEYMSSYICSYKQFSTVLVISAHAITSDVSLQETAKAAEFFLSDGIIITGATTGDPVDTGNLHGELQLRYRHLLL